MKIIVGGAGSVGKSIVAYLSRGNNDVAVVDEDERKLNEVAREWDVMPVLGSVAHPDVLQKAEAGKSDLLIAATESDEVNMIACQAAYSLFNVPRKVARISARVYHKAAWGGLFGDHDIPVDLAVSPEYEIAGAIKRVLQFPGISGICPFAGKKLMLLSFRCPKKSPLLQIPLDHLERRSLICILRWSTSSAAAAVSFPAATTLSMPVTKLTCWRRQTKSKTSSAPSALSARTTNGCLFLAAIRLPNIWRKRWKKTTALPAAG